MRHGSRDPAITLFYFLERDPITEVYLSNPKNHVEWRINEFGRVFSQHYLCCLSFVVTPDLLLLLSGLFELLLCLPRETRPKRGA